MSAPAETACTAWDHRRRVIITLASHIGLQACVCREAGVLRRGPLEWSGTWFSVGALVVPAESVGAITLERDLVTIHLGEIA